MKVSYHMKLFSPHVYYQFGGVNRFKVVHSHFEDVHSKFDCANHFETVEIYCDKSQFVVEKDSSLFFIGTEGHIK